MEPILTVTILEGLLFQEQCPIMRIQYVHLWVQHLVLADESCVVLAWIAIEWRHIPDLLEAGEIW